MKKSIYQKLLGCFLLCCCYSATAEMITLDFNDVPTGTVITDQFSSIDVIFTTMQPFPFAGPVTDERPELYGVDNIILRIIMEEAPLDAADIELSFTKDIDYFSLQLLDADEKATINAYYKDELIETRSYPSGSDTQVWDVVFGEVGGLVKYDRVLLDVVNAGNNTYRAGPEYFDNLKFNTVPLSNETNGNPVQNSPTPIIKANGSDDAVTINSDDNLKVEIGLDSGNGVGINADWWLVVTTPFGWFRYDLGSGSWVPGVNVTYQNALFSFDQFEFLNVSGLPGGIYTFYFAVDMLMNGALDFEQLHFDSVEVNVTPHSEAFLSFPLDCGDKNCNFLYSQGAYTPNSITSILDHQMDSIYTSDGVVTAFTGETGIGTAVNQGCYPKVGGGSFSVMGLYLGTNDGCLPYQGLNYDNHPAYDYYAEVGTPVKAAAGGKVVKILNTKTNTYGACVPRGIDKDGCEVWGFVGIDHGNGYITQYGHLSEIKVDSDDDIVEGQIIGKSGNKAPVYLAPHFHFEVLKQHKDKQYGYAFVDPYGWEGTPETDYLAKEINKIENIKLWK